MTFEGSLVHQQDFMGSERFHYDMPARGNVSVVSTVLSKLKSAASRPGFAKMIYLNQTLAPELVVLVKKLRMIDGKTMWLEQRFLRRRSRLPQQRCRSACLSKA
jgi:hypothetical protein